MMKVLLVEPAYYTRYPPLGLLKLASYYRSRGIRVDLVRGSDFLPDLTPDRIEITSLFTYAWPHVHEAVARSREYVPAPRIRVGGIYASLLPGHISSSFPGIAIHSGLYEEADKYLPAYDLLTQVDKWRNWDTSILFTSRGCSRKCPFCVVPRLEGKLRSVVDGISHLLYPEYKKVTIWDNNFLASPSWREILQELNETGLRIDFNQGLDARLLDEEKAGILADLKLPMIRMAYDSIRQKTTVAGAVDLLSEQGFRKRNISFYVLYNFYDSGKKRGDTPNDFMERIRYIGQLGCVSYPMRYEPLDSLEKNKFVSPLWSHNLLELIAKARRVIGYGGAFPPYKGLVEKLNDAGSCEDAFSLRPAVS